MSEKRIREILSTDFLCVETSCPLPEAINLLCDLNSKDSVPKTLVVFDRNQVFWGLITLECILENVRPPFMRHSREGETVTWNGLLTESCRNATGLRVEDVVDRTVPRLHPEDRVIKAVDLLLRTHHRELPVLEDGKIIGVLHAGDVILEIKAVIAHSSGKLEGFGS
ncbi:MAG: CBS domain-containing protein [Pseudomonadota bacterium]